MNEAIGIFAHDMLSGFGNPQWHSSIMFERLRGSDSTKELSVHWNFRVWAATK